jgi:hypothetical protein
VCQAAAKVISGMLRRELREHLSLAGEAAKCLGVKHAGSIASERRAVGMGRLGEGAPGKFTGLRNGDGSFQNCVHITGHASWLYRSTGRRRPCGISFTAWANGRVGDHRIAATQAGINSPSG